jgi:hypothetical protein
MEGIENTDARSLRVMRFRFEANDSLNDQVALQLDERRRKLVAFAFYGSRQLLLTMNDYYKREGDLQKIGKRFRGFREPIHLKPVARSHEINDHTTRLQFVPVEQGVFDAMTSLDLVAPEEDYGWNTPPLPNLIMNQPEKGHYIFVDVPTDALLGDRQRKMANMALTNEIAANRLWLHTLALSTVRDMHFKDKTETDTPDDDELERVG